MKSSEYLYSRYYDKDFVQKHIRLFHRQIIWAEDTIRDLLNEPLETRDMRRINDCLEAVNWNRKKIAEANEKEVE